MAERLNKNWNRRLKVYYKCEQDLGSKTLLCTKSSQSVECGDTHQRNCVKLKEQKLPLKNQCHRLAWLSDSSKHISKYKVQLKYNIIGTNWNKSFAGCKPKTKTRISLELEQNLNFCILTQYTISFSFIQLSQFLFFDAFRNFDNADSQFDVLMHSPLPIKVGITKSSDRKGPKLESVGAMYPFGWF